MLELTQINDSLFRETDLPGFKLNDYHKGLLIKTIKNHGGATVLFNDSLQGRYIIGTEGFKIENTSDEDIYSRAIDTVQGLAVLASDTSGYGVWKDKDHIYFDAIHVTNDRNKAIKLAKKYDQLAIFDNENKEVEFLKG